MIHRWMLTLAIPPLFAAWAGVAFSESPPEEDAVRGYSKISGNVVVLDPLSIDPPFPTLLREAQKDDLLELQIQYPVVPPMPKAVRVATQHNRLSFVTSAFTTSKVAILSQTPQTNGALGVGYVQVYLRANRRGRDSATVRLEMEDGTVKKVPFEFEID